MSTEITRIIGTKPGRKEVDVADAVGVGDGEGATVGVGDGKGAIVGVGVGESDGVGDVGTVGLGEGDAVGTGEGVGVGEGDVEGDCVAVGIGEGATVGLGVGEGLVLIEGAGVTFLILTPLFQTSFLFFLTQVKRKPLETWVVPALLHLAPGLGATASAFEIGNNKETNIAKAKPNLRMSEVYLSQKFIASFYLFPSKRSKDHKSSASRLITSNLLTARISAICARCSVA